MSTQTLITSRDDKGRHAVNLFAIEYDKAKLDGERAQRLNERGGELQDGIAKLIAELSVSNRYANEEVESTYGYLSGYKPKSITEQTNRLRELIPDIGDANEKLAEADLPPNAKGWFAIPRWEKVAPTYSEAVQKVLDLIKQTRSGKFCNYREGWLEQQHLRQHARTVNALNLIGEAQSNHDILVVPAQFGLWYRGCSVRRAREVFQFSEFGLGTFQVACMLLTHPERLQCYDDLWIDCAGDEFTPDAGGDFWHAPCFSFGGGEVRFGAGWIGDPSGSYGSVSAFVPQF